MSAVAIHVVRRLPLARPLAVRDFRLLWVGEIISMTGSSFTSVALAWLALQLTGSGLALGTVLLVGSIPRIVLILIGGARLEKLELPHRSLRCSLLSSSARVCPAPPRAIQSVP